MEDDSGFCPIEDRHGIKHEADESAEAAGRVGLVQNKKGGRPDNQVFDRDELVGRCGGDAGVAARIAAKFRNRSGRDLEDLQSAIGEQDLDSVAETAHRLKGVAASMAAHRLAERYRELEVKAREGDLSAAPELLIKLKAETAMFNDALASAFGALAIR